MQRLAAAALVLWLAPILSVGAAGFGLPLAASVAAGTAIAAATAAGTARLLSRRLDARLPAWIALALLLASAAAIVRFGALSVFMADARRLEFSVAPDDPFRRHHSCVSAYAESARFLAVGHHNIYERALYRPGGEPRELGPLRVDAFHYPPPFLLLPQALRLAAPDFWDFRRVWFAIQAVTLAGAIVAAAAWIGGLPGAVALLGGALLLAFPHAAYTFQQGNFQATAVPVAAVAFGLLAAGRPATGAAALAYAALSKIFPGILVVPLLAARQWRAAGWVAAWGVVILAITLTVQGVQPMRDFFSTSLPEISSGAAFPQTETLQHSRVNWSAYGQTVRLRQLGAEWLTQRRGLMVAQVYGLLVVALALWAGWNRRFDPGDRRGRLALVQLTLALLSLASFRSPFVGAAYGVLATLWLMGILAAAAATRRGAAAWIVALCAMAGATWLVPSPGEPPSVPWLWGSGLLVLSAMAVNVWAVVDAVRTARGLAAVEDSRPPASAVSW
ncbi:MAG TPA: glycosyltransferase family 87 protein [Vicinamibacterales bacterium]|nr:glycosyltransferase family 87 protein [Vicinamibacterales bacterium]